MPRKPNYRFERAERDRSKAAKKAKRLQAKQDKVDDRKAQAVVVDPEAAASQD